MRRFLRRMNGWPVILAFIILVFSCLFLGAPAKPKAPVVAHDDSDPPGGFSGLDVHTDNLTGCQYLSVRNAGVTPRLDATGRQVCNLRGKAN